MFIRLSDTPNRAILYDLFPYIWDVKEVVLLLDSFVNWLGKFSSQGYSMTLTAESTGFFEGRG